jgi:hypothetical protein
MLNAKKKERKKERKANLPRNFLLKHVIEGRI